jgi:hypothetical protein
MMIVPANARMAISVRSNVDNVYTCRMVEMMNKAGNRNATMDATAESPADSREAAQPEIPKDHRVKVKSGDETETEACNQKKQRDKRKACHNGDGDVQPGPDRRRDEMPRG